MSIVDGTGLTVWEGGLFEQDSDLLRRLKWAFAQIRAAGGTIILNEAGRPYGVPADQYARSAADTASGLSTVWQQWGRYLRGETPSAADPRAGELTSEHTQGKAVDCNAPTARDMALREHYFALVGLKQTIASESWHWAIRGAPQVDINPFTTASAEAAPLREDDDMKYELGSDDRDGIYVLGPQGVSAIPGGGIQLPLFQRLVAGERRFTAAEWKAIDETLNKRL